MTTVSDISAWMERFAPLSLAEAWDNVGLLFGDRTAAVDRVMTCLTVTPDSAQEAIAERATLIVSHHPILFRPTQKLTADKSEGAMLWRLARAGIAIYSPHTALDNADDGINAGLARRLGLVDVVGLRPCQGEAEFKVGVFVLSSDRDRVLNAAFGAGAGQIGNYEECSFTSGGFGTFFGNEAAHPTIGRAGRRERVREWKLEVVCRLSRIDRVLAAIREAHSYEEPAIDVYPLRQHSVGPGIGRLGRLSLEMTLDQFAGHVRKALGCGPVGIVGESSRRIRQVAISCGAGDDFVNDAAKTGADVLVTGEARFHRALEAEASGIALILAGHHATERPGVEDLAARLGEAFPALLVWASQKERDPIRYLFSQA
jgi:dinuclear metal center YbgI/SA1388 family protein